MDRDNSPFSNGANKMLIVCGCKEKYISNSGI